MLNEYIKYFLETAISQSKTFDDHLKLAADEDKLNRDRITHKIKTTQPKDDSISITHYQNLLNPTDLNTISYLNYLPRSFHSSEKIPRKRN